MRKSRTMLAVFCVFLMLCCLPGCRKTSASESASVDGSATAESAGGTRDNTPQVLNPEAPGTSVIGNDLIEIDLSNTTEGYVGARYSGSASSHIQRRNQNLSPGCLRRHHGKCQCQCQYLYPFFHHVRFCSPLSVLGIPVSFYRSFPLIHETFYHTFL